ncbi:MAG: DUF2207 domain-containing protein [Candidatus Saccharimonadales bacterium]
MKRWATGGIVAALLVLAGITTPSAHADVNDFQISSYDMTLRLSRDAEMRSVLKTEETIVAEFPFVNQNHGIERAIPKQYDGHSTSLEVISVKDGNGSIREYTTYDDENGNKIIRIGNANTYVQGKQTYVITYQQRDVTRYFSNTNADEFYWDTNGTAWRVPIEKLNVRLIIDEALAKSATGNVSCYQGYSGSKAECEIVREDDVTLAMQATKLAPGQNITIATGFSKGTFGSYKMSFFETIMQVWVWLQIALAVVAVGTVAYLGYRLYRLRNRPDEIGTIVPEYLPPIDASVSLAALVAKGGVRSSVAAQWIDLAVRHYIKLYQVKEKSLFRPAQFEVELIRSPHDLKWEELALLQDSFITGTSLKIGDRLNFETLKKDTGYATRLQSHASTLKDRIKGEYGLRSEDEKGKRALRQWATWLFIAAVLLLSPPLAVAAFCAFGMSWYVHPLTDKGLALRRYLSGLKEYIGVAEAERLQMLQSPEGAAKVAAVSQGVESNVQLIKLYERVLPYAVLFGLEKQWNEQLGAYYEQAHTSPEWFSGSSGVYNAAAFSSVMSGFSSAASYGSSSSSDSGGSSGGGSSGGGGGGGGGGGW